MTLRQKDEEKVQFFFFLTLHPFLTRFNFLNIGVLIYRYLF